MRKGILLLAAAATLAACDRPPATRPADAAADADLRALVDSMLPSLARLASLEPRRAVTLARRDSAQVRAFVEQRLDEELPAADLDALRSTYALLGLVPDTLDLRALLLRLYTEQIVGYYDPSARTLYVVEGVEPAAVAPVLAHELVHALQDQHANLDSLIAPARGNDRRTAAHAALEGHATVVMFAYLAEQAAGRPLDPTALPNPAPELAAGLTAQNELFPVFRAAPRIVRETMLFPYIGGAEFVYRLWQAERLDRPAPLGTWLPHSTEQVLHPAERFLRERDDPTPLAFAPSRGAWRAVGEDDSLGELEMGIFLDHHLGEGARAAAHGWDGDRYRLLENASGERALLWLTVWDDEASAARFARALERIARDPRAVRIEIAAQRVGDRQVVRAVFRRGPAPADPELPAGCIGTAPCNGGVGE